MLHWITVLSGYAVPLLLLGIPVYAFFKKVPLYETFVEGAAQGLHIVIKIFPYLLGMLLAIAVFRASGAFDLMAQFLRPVCSLLGIPPEVLPLAIMRPLSGSGALGITAELLNTYGADSFIGRLASVMQGSTDTTFYVLAVYFGSVGIRRYRYALAVGLGADIVSFLASVLACHLFFSS